MRVNLQCTLPDGRAVPAQPGGPPGLPPAPPAWYGSWHAASFLGRATSHRDTRPISGKRWTLKFLFFQHPSLNKLLQQTSERVSAITHSRAVLLLQTNSILHWHSFFQLSTCSISQLLSSSAVLPLGMCWGGTGAGSQGTEVKRLARDHVGISYSHETKAWHPRHLNASSELGFISLFGGLLMIKMKRLSWHKQLPIQPMLLTPKRMKWTPWNTSNQNPSVYFLPLKKLFWLIICREITN